MILFVVKLAIEEGNFDIPYSSVEECLYDCGLPELFRIGAICSIWVGDTRITRDIKDWDRLRQQLISNSATLLRKLLT